MTLFGSKYIAEECSLLLRAENEKSVFGDLLGIWIANYSDLLFRVSELETGAFNDALNSYEVEKVGEALASLNVTPGSLLNHEVLHKWKLGDRLFINTKNDLADLCEHA